MLNNKVTDIYHSLLELAWHFGNQGLDGECCDNLSLVEFMALKRISGNKNLSIQDIANTLNFTKSGATRIIDRLENKEYVLRERSPMDGRVCCVNTTVKGQKIVTKIIEQYTTYLQDKLKNLEPNTLENIKMTLDILVKSVNQ